MRNTTVLTIATLAILMLCLTAFFILAERFPILGLCGAMLMILVAALFGLVMLTADARRTYDNRGDRSDPRR